MSATSGRRFVKTLPAAAADRLAAEVDGLAAIAATGTVRVPAVIDSGEANGQAWLALEWLDLERPDAACDAMLGERLAAMHRVTGDAFGWARDNWIGATPQPNGFTDDWVDFLRRRRFGWQLERVERNGYGADLADRGERLLERLPGLFDGYVCEPSLLHGDLWSGNHGSVGGEPVIFDPAVYFGDRETDLAMTRLFGGFGATFYRAYESTWPLAAGHERRNDLYQLYHVLNHLNLFGRAYLAQAIGLMDKLV